jgi:hypothetical protein
MAAAVSRTMVAVKDEQLRPIHPNPMKGARKLLGTQAKHQRPIKREPPPPCSSFGLFVGFVSGCLRVPVDETVDSRKGYHFGSPKC